MKNNNHFGAQKGEISHSEMENLDRYLSPAAQTPGKAIRSPFPYLRQAAGGQEAAPPRKAAAELCGGASLGSRKGPQGPRALSRPGAPGAAPPRSTARRPCRELLPAARRAPAVPLGEHRWCRRPASGSSTPGRGWAPWCVISCQLRATGV